MIMLLTEVFLCTLCITLVASSIPPASVENSYLCQNGRLEKCENEPERALLLRFLKRILDDSDETPSVEKQLHTVECKGSLAELDDPQRVYIASLLNETKQLLDGTIQEDKKRLRRECRSLAEEERDKLFSAIVSLKSNCKLQGGSTCYDTIAALHKQQVTLDNAHFGSNFLGWHRIYLLTYENALRRLSSEVTLCYWDSTLDYIMPERVSDTVSFSAKLFGNGRGVVSTGKFRNWPLEPGRDGPLLIRNINTIGSLMRPKVVDKIAYDESIIHHTQITDNGEGFTVTDPYKPSEKHYSLEQEHNNCHNWVGGDMQGLETAPQDPVFFFHHTFIDYVWELFRIKAKRLGLDPADDYPGDGDGKCRKIHAADAPMQCFYNADHVWINKFGYNNNFTDIIYDYAQYPTCGNNCGGSTEFLYCPIYGDPTQRCVSRIESPSAAIGMKVGLTSVVPERLKTATPIKAFFNDERND